MLKLIRVRPFTLLIILFSIINTNTIKGQDMEESNYTSNLETATLASGCFWCTEAVFEQLKGVVKVTSGYAGGELPDPTYEIISSGRSGYAEVCQVVFDPEIISYQSLLEIFWKMHDPTTLNRQGADVGTQYRSAIFYHTDLQKSTAEFFKVELDNAKIWPNPIVTEITAMGHFYEAEKYHQNYYKNNPNNPYCSLVITPKVKKLEQIFADRLK